MQAGGLALIVGCGVVFAAALLLNASAGKLISSRLTEVALHETFGFPRSAGVGIAVRGMAIVESVTAVGLVIDRTRIIAIVVTSLLGFSFAVFGVIAHLRGVTVPCGCLGSIDKHPIGLRNAAVGTVLALLLPLSIIAPPFLPSTLAACLVSITAIVLSVYLNRGFTVEPLLSRPGRGSEIHG